MRQKYVSESVVAPEFSGLSDSVVSEFDLAEASVSSMRDSSDNPGVPNPKPIISGILGAQVAYVKQAEF